MTTSLGIVFFVRPYFHFLRSCFLLYCFVHGPVGYGYFLNKFILLIDGTYTGTSTTKTLGCNGDEEALNIPRVPEFERRHQIQFSVFPRILSFQRGHTLL